MNALALGRLRSPLLGPAVWPCLALILGRTGLVPLALICPLLRPAGLVPLTLGPCLLRSAGLTALILAPLLESAALNPLALASSLLDSAGLRSLTLKLSLLRPTCLTHTAPIRTLLSRNSLGTDRLYGLPLHPLGTQRLYGLLALTGSCLASGLLAAC